MPLLHLFALAAALNIFQINSITPGTSITIPKGTKIYTKLAGAVSTASLEPNMPIIFNVVAPYPLNDNAFKGAQILAFVTEVQHGSANSRAGVGFIFDSVLFANGTKRRVYAYVDGPQVKRIDQPAIQPPSAPNPMPGPTNLAAMQPGGQPVLWEANLTSQPFANAPKTSSGPHNATGGFAHARQNGTDATMPAGAPVSLILAQDFRAPAPTP